MVANAPIAFSLPLNDMFILTLSPFLVSTKTVFPLLTFLILVKGTIKLPIFLFISLFNDYTIEYGPMEAVRLSTEFLDEISLNFKSILNNNTESKDK